MSAVSLTIKALLAQAGVTGTTSTRIYPFPLPPTTTLPAIAVAMTAEDEEYLLSGASQYPETSVQIHCIALKAKDAIALGEAVKTALRDHLYSSGATRASFKKDGPDFTDYADDLSTHRRLMTYTVRWR
jgi:hypothetical protein